jgi:GNAT superfamily N-acetyltransferase
MFDSHSNGLITQIVMKPSKDQDAQLCFVSTVTECLQYPDFSCVVLYKKLVVGFAFMVPNVGLNEAYISFLFTRPEWRRAGIATFMLYHLIQASEQCVT